MWLLEIAGLDSERCARRRWLRDFCLAVNTAALSRRPPPLPAPLPAPPRTRGGGQGGWGVWWCAVRGGGQQEAGRRPWPPHEEGRACAHVSACVRACVGAVHSTLCARRMSGPAGLGPRTRWRKAEGTVSDRMRRPRNPSSGPWWGPRSSEGRSGERRARLSAPLGQGPALGCSGPAPLARLG